MDYVYAVAPDAGESTAQQYQGFAAKREFVIDTHEDGINFLSLEKFKAGFAHDVRCKGPGSCRSTVVGFPQDGSGTAWP